MPAVFLMGPTASGKTDVAVDLVQRFPFEIISVDSAMVYRGMDIGTAKPDAATLARAPHRLIDILDPVQPYSAAQFREDALREMDDIRARGHIPLLVGGTMLYFRALEQGLSELPSADAEVRAALEAEAERIGWDVLHARLAELDPVAAERIHPNDPQRIQRALEVIELTGRPLSEQQGARNTGGAAPGTFLKLALVPEQRDLLHARIEKRFHAMIDAGFLDEVRALRARGDLSAELPAMRAVGYRQAWAFLEGNIHQPQWIEAGITATRQYAKRQMTWLRSDSGLNRFDCLDPYRLERMVEFLAKELTL